jgi:hypothetical protein
MNSQRMLIRNSSVQSFVICIVYFLFIGTLNDNCGIQYANCQMHWEKIFDSLSYKLSEKPAPRREAAVGHDRNRNRVIVFGGWQVNPPDNKPYSLPVLFDDTWEFNLYTSNKS